MIVWEGDRLALASLSSSISSFLRLAVALTLRTKRIPPTSSSLELPPLGRKVCRIVGGAVLGEGVLRVGVDSWLLASGEACTSGEERGLRVWEVGVAADGDACAAVELLAGPLLPGVLSGDASTLLRCAGVLMVLLVRCIGLSPSLVLPAVVGTLQPACRCDRLDIVRAQSVPDYVIPC